MIFISTISPALIRDLSILVEELQYNPQCSFLFRLLADFKIYIQNSCQFSSLMLPK